MDRHFSCHCRRTPCRCSASYPVAEPNVVIVSAGSQVVGVPQAYQSPPPASPDTPGSQSLQPLQKLSSSVTMPEIGSQVNVTATGAGSFTRAGDILHIPGWGQMEVVSAAGDNILAKNLSITPGVTLATGQEFRIGNPVDRQQIGRTMCDDASSGGMAKNFLGCVDGSPQGTNRFTDDAIPLASDQELAAGFAPLARLNSTGSLRRIAPLNGKVLQASGGAWRLDDYQAGISYRTPWHTVMNTGLIYSANHTLGNFDISGLPGYSAQYGTMWLKASITLGVTPGYLSYAVSLGSQKILETTVKTEHPSTDSDTNGADIVFPWPVSPGIVTVYGAAAITSASSFRTHNFTLQLIGWQR